jgi:hypothetical protein
MLFGFCVIMLNVVLLIVILLNVILLIAILLIVILLSALMLNVKNKTVTVLCVILLSSVEC